MRHMNRRQCLGLTAGSMATSVVASATLGMAGTSPKIQAILFDAFPIFDPRPVFALAEELFPGKGLELSNEWRTRQFEYTWLRTVSRQYVDFWQVTEDSLVFAAKKLKLEVSQSQRERLLNAYLTLKTWPDVPQALTTLKDAGLRLAFLSNFTPRMLESAIKTSGLGSMFEHVLSTDSVKTYKPESRAYQMGIDAFKIPREAMLFVAFAGWDAAGAKWFGYPTFWVNRLNQPVEELGVVPDATGTNLADLVRYVRS
jgi:2-haloacid dehalogenase